MPTANEYKSQIGVDMMHIALVTQDDADGYAAETPEMFAPAIKISGEPQTSLDEQYADNIPYDVIPGEGSTKFSMSVTNIPLETLCKVLGKEFDPVTGMMYDAGGGATPPFVALSFRSLKRSGKQRCFQYLKGVFSAPKEEAQTAAEKKTPIPAEISFVAIYTTHKFTTAAGTKPHLRVVGDEDIVNFDSSNFFNYVHVPGMSEPSALALSSSVPADDAGGVNATANLTLTYNNALDARSLATITLLDDAQAPVEAEITLDATKKIVTINPDESLEADTAYTLVAHARDIYGQTLASVVTFETAA